MTLAANKQIYGKSEFDLYDSLRQNSIDRDNDKCYNILMNE